MRNIKQLVCSFIVAISFSPLALANISLGAPSSGPLASIGKFLQEIVDFLGGTGTLFVAFVGVFLGIAMWVMIPKNAGPAVAFIMRAMVGAIALFTLGLTITWLQSF